MGFANDGSNPRLRLLRGFSIFGGRDYQHSRPGEQCMIPKCSMVLECLATFTQNIPSHVCSLQMYTGKYIIHGASWSISTDDSIPKAEARWPLNS